MMKMRKKAVCFWQLAFSLLLLTIGTPANSQELTANSQQPFFIDFQGGRRGPYYYDLASFLWQASAKYPHKLRRELVFE